ncbi:O-acetylhomoserine aminocarboxypropyltransferase/cysteine synthase [Solidesulfovibrio sp.]|uniref:O-acetylhomoserine aminocarboxypropyltransferase/cysteine synthase family protein n=1 Tax=Solidesulfovibrio sp. TaxID=2910990 RepID=UPI002B1F1CF6|nr:O-acetylhomoserine aminocarboxypropyltransferase/cysteine synthase [Solidesulfovibrio sp.]MEA4856709.1 O-acetylhomoserine aminocarboxypropyltransferase/cysteine synthase [Solidesulfovibrio sp.]
MSERHAKPGFGTLALHAGQVDDPTTHARAVPIYATASYNFTDTDHAANLFGLREFGNIYSRLMNPTNDVLEKRLAALDGGIGGLALASGQAAITAAILTITHAGQNFIASKNLYGGTWTLFTQTFKKLGVTARFFDPAKPEAIRELADADPRCVYIESLGNPRNDVPDFGRLAEIAHALGVPLIVDNTVTPLVLRPIEHGADIVVYSTTKFLGGHGVHIGGAIVDSGNFPWAADPAKWPEFAAPDPAYHGMVFTDALAPLGNLAYVIHIRTHWLRDTGGCMSPFAAFLFLLGVETLHLRMPRHCANALAVARFLEAHPAVAWVNYPGLESHPDHALAGRYLPDGAGAIIGFGIKGGREAGARLINNVKLASHLANIGDAKTLIIHPASTTHQQLTDEEQRATGVTPEYVRLSVGIEDAADIIADLDQALRAAVGA